MLSFGPDARPLELLPLNVLIGPNGSGKSNLLEAIALLRSAPTKLAAPIRGSGSGGIAEWIWKGAPLGTAHLEVVIDNPDGRQPLRHAIEFAASSSKFELMDEWIKNALPYAGHEDANFYYKYQGGRPVLAVRDGGERKVERQDIALDESILSQRKDPDQYPELAHLARTYGRIRLFREWSFGRASIFRSPQSADMPNDLLEEDFSNLGLFLNHLRSVPKAKSLIVQRLRDLYAGLDDFDVRVKGGSVEVFLQEGDFVIPASRLSDGTLRYLCLLAILCDPVPPPLICIEEPELGLHPDIIPKIADLLKSASDRTQLIVTTHSDILVDAMSDRPESVVVVEKEDAATQTRRLEANSLTNWLKEYRLGQLWTKGQIGGTRW
jgi:predicted ATPase